LVTWSNCHTPDKKLITYKWKDVTLYLPNNYENKLIRRYGPDWKTPKDTKGPPRLNIL